MLLVIGNKAYSSYRLKDVIKTRESNILSFLGNGDIYDPDRVTFDRELLRRFWLPVLLSEELPEPDEHGINLGFSVEADRPQGRMALVGARLITMKGAEVIERGDILVRDNRIAAVGPAGSLQVPQGTREMDMAGKTIVPGFIDTHCHVSGVNELYAVNANVRRLRELLAARAER